MMLQDTQEQRKCILTLDNGQTENVTLLFKKNEPIFIKELEENLVNEINASQQNLIHKVVKCHVIRN